MSSAKALLKAVGDAIKQQKFDDAIDKAKEALVKDSKSYQGYVYSSDLHQFPSDSHAWFLH